MPIHLQPAYAELGLGPGSFPVTERLAGEILSLPMYPELTRELVEQVADAVTRDWSRGGNGSGDRGREAGNDAARDHRPGRRAARAQPWLRNCRVGPRPRSRSLARPRRGAIAGASATSRSSWSASRSAALALPAAAALFGGIRRLLLALVVIDIPLQFDVNPGYRDDVAALSALSRWRR